MNDRRPRRSISGATRPRRRATMHCRANAIHRGPDDRLHRRARPGDRAPRTSSPAFSSVAALDAIETKYERKGKRVEIVGLDRASADRHGRLSGRLP